MKYITSGRPNPRCSANILVIQDMHTFPSLLYRGGKFPCVPCVAPYIPPILLGRATSGGDSGAHSTFTVGFGSASAIGTWIVAIAYSTSGTLSISGGSNPWTLLGGVGSQSKFWAHFVTSGEPATYTVTFNGAAKADGATITMLEILKGNASNPDNYATATSTAACPSVTSSAATDIVVTGLVNASGVIPSPPSGYTVQASGTSGSLLAPCGSVLAASVGVGVGSISPGSWSAVGALVGSVSFKA